jgi:HTH DNA binding domain
MSTTLARICVANYNRGASLGILETIGRTRRGQDLLNSRRDDAEGNDTGGDRDDPPQRGVGVGAAVTRTPGSTNSGMQLETIRLGAESRPKDRDRWLAQRYVLARKLQGRRVTSKLPALIDLVVNKPLVSSSMVAAALGITPRAAQKRVASWRCPRLRASPR